MNLLNNGSIQNRKALPIKIVQFGGGNFLRAFVDWMVQILNDGAGFNAGVAIIKPTENGDYQDLIDQDGLFTVVTDGILNGKLTTEKLLVSCVSQVINPYSDWESYLNLAKSNDLRFLVSNTTEAGIKFNPGDRFKDRPPKEFPGKAALFLYHRFLHLGNAPNSGLIFLPCELIENNGAVLKNTILQYADHWNLGSDFKNYVHSENYFCNTLVDRIVSGYPKDRIAALEKELGYTDNLLVAGEYYHSWIIEGGAKIKKELPFSGTGLNVRFVNDLAPYRTMKVRILNGGHTAMVPVAYMAGMKTVNEAMEDKVVLEFITSFLVQEVLITLDFPIGEKHKFVQDVLARFKNPTLKHQLIAISLNSTSKFVVRLLPTLKEYLLLEGKLPKRLVFSLAALLCFYKGDLDGEGIPLQDNRKNLDHFTEVWSRYDSKTIDLNEVVFLLLGDKNIWGEDLNAVPGLTKMVSEYSISIRTYKMHGALKAL